MSIDNLTKILLAGTSLCMGAYLTAMRAKINSTNSKNKLHYAFYAVTIILFIISLCTILFCWKELFYEKEILQPNLFAITIVILCIISTVLLFLFTYKNLAGKHHYKSAELDPIVNKFTSNSDKNTIKLLAGDIDFFGKSPQQMDLHPQYSCLKNEGFRQIELLCIKPITSDQKMRYGKILNDFPQIKLKHYDPPQADLNVRGRLKTLNGVIHLLIYNKIQSGIYEAIPIDTANSNGALYNNLWELTWQLAKEPSKAEIDECIALFRN